MRASSGPVTALETLAAWLRDFSADRAAFSPLKYILSSHLTAFLTAVVELILNDIIINVVGSLLW